MKIGAVAPWYGSKRTMAPRLVHQLGPHHAYWEPFCGSCAVLMAKPPCRMETVNDLHADLINMVRVMAHGRLGTQLYRQLRRVLASQIELEEARERLNAIAHSAKGVLDINRARDYFINSWLGMNGTAGTGAAIDGRRGIARRFSSLGGAPAVRFASAVDSIPAWRRRLRRVFVLNDDGIELCEKIEDLDGCVILADPPYVEKTEEYVHDFASEDHKRLATALCRFKKTRVVLCYYAHQSLADLYPGWTVLDASMRKMLAHATVKGKAKGAVAPEVILINGPANPETADEKSLF